MDVVECLRFVNGKGFCSVDRDKLFGENITNWAKPPRDGIYIAPWKKLWDESNPTDPQIPTGAPMYVDVRNSRGIKSRFCFLGSIDGESTSLKTPGQVLVDSHWKLPTPSMCISTDAGSMHPRQCDTEKKMHHMPQFREWVDEQKSEQATSAALVTQKNQTERSSFADNDVVPAGGAVGDDDDDAAAAGDTSRRRRRRSMAGPRHARSSKSTARAASLSSPTSSASPLPRGRRSSRSSTPRPSWATARSTT